MSRKTHETDTKSAEEFRLGEFIFSTHSNELKDKSGNAVYLRSQSSDVLAYLILHHGVLVTKEDMISNIWPDTFVTDDSLVQCIADIRRALNDVDFKIIQTLPKRGYKIDAVPVKGPPVGLSDTQQRIGSRIGKLGSVLTLALLALVVGGVVSFSALRDGASNPDTKELAAPVLQLPEKPSIAVLAFDDLSQGDDEGYLSDAIVEGIITQLSHFSELFVIARNSSFYYREAPKDLRNIGRELGVRYVLEGSQQKAGADLRITVQLIDTADGRHVWSRVFDRDLSEILVVQDEISTSVAATLGEKLYKIAGEEHKRASPEELRAYEHVITARRHFREFTREGSEKAKQATEAALALDPNLARAHGNMAWIHINGVRWGWGDLDRETALIKAKEEARTAVRLAPDDYNSYSTLAAVHMHAGEREQAFAAFTKALELNPNAGIVMANLAEQLGYAGRFEEAEQLMLRAMRLDPHHPDWYFWNVSWIEYSLGKCDDAVSTLHRMSNRPPKSNRVLAASHICLGQPKEARQAIQDLLTHDPEYSVTKFKLNFERKRYAPDLLEAWVQDLRAAGLPD